MNNNQLQRLAQLVYVYCGINYHTNLPSLNLKIKRRLNQLKLNTINEYLDFLVDNTEEWHRLVELLTINETYFYREEKQLHEYIGTVVPLLKNNSNDTIKVWSAGCSSGEEPYSLAILALEAGYNHLDIQIKATDINKKVVDIASRGEYNKTSLSFRRVPNKWLSKYFNEDEKVYQIKECVQQFVTFGHLNLIDLSKVPVNETYDVIFCRNVLIYFDEATINNIIKGFYNRLRPGGYLFLGHTETVSKEINGLKLIHSEGTFYYRKEL